MASLGDADRLVSDARVAVRDGADLLEIRADHFSRACLSPESLRSLLAQLRRSVRKPLLLTLRLRAEGGRLPRAVTEWDRLALIRAGLSEVDGVDVELAAEDIRRHVVSEAHKRRRFVILSHHDFKKTPSDAILRRLSRKAKSLEADLFKVAALPVQPNDVQRMMEACRRDPFPRRTYIAMGPLGRSSRLEGFRWGSLLAYAYVRVPLAPGQMRVRDVFKSLKENDFPVKGQAVAGGKA